MEVDERKVRWEPQSGPDPGRRARLGERGHWPLLQRRGELLARESFIPCRCPHSLGVGRGEQQEGGKKPGLLTASGGALSYLLPVILGRLR